MDCIQKPLEMNGQNFSNLALRNDVLHLDIIERRVDFSQRPFEICMQSLYHFMHRVESIVLSQVIGCQALVRLPELGNLTNVTVK